MINYADYKGQIHHLAFRWSRILGRDADDLFSEGNVVFCTAVKKWDESRGKFTTFLNTCIINHFKTISSREKEKGLLVDEMPVAEDTRTPEQLYSFKNQIESLSSEAQEIIKITLSGPSEMAQLQNLQSYLRECGWAWGTIWGTFKEIKEIFQGGAS
jgi:DNA-directed RNA polymerase specialized sigma24 family protein